MPITVIESEWRETPIFCPDCGGVMCSDGKSLPVCGNPNCLKRMTLYDLLEWLITDRGEPEVNQ